MYPSCKLCAGTSSYWSGMLGDLYRDVADAALGTIFHLEDRVAISEPPQPFVTVYSVFVVPKLVICTIFRWPKAAGGEKMLCH